jgi:outer membrane immunogenic protein
MICGKVTKRGIMLKKILLGSISAATLTASAYAADLRPAPYVPPPPVFSWTGAYVGLNAGGVFNWNNQDVVFAAPGGCAIGTGCFGGGAVPPLALGRSFANGINLAGLGLNNGNNNRGGFIGGGQIGINWQWNTSFVFGAELDGQGVWTNRNDNGNFGIAAVGEDGFPQFTTTAFVRFNHRLEYLGTARARAGFLATPAFLIYATGGAAVGGVRTNGFAFATINDNSVTSGLPAVLTGSNSRVGWTAGGGIEWMFLPNWSLKGEALYYDLGRFHTSFGEVTSLAAVGGGLVGSALTVATFRERGVIARAGINYHFFSAPAAPVVARY